jgi:hypothetical protein
VKAGVTGLDRGVTGAEIEQELDVSPLTLTLRQVESHRLVRHHARVPQVLLRHDLVRFLLEHICIHVIMDPLYSLCIDSYNALLLDALHLPRQLDFPINIMLHFFTEFHVFFNE